VKINGIDGKGVWHTGEHEGVMIIVIGGGEGIRHGGEYVV